MDRSAGRLAGEEWLAAGVAGLYAFDYTLDAAGNRTRLTKNNVTTYYDYNTLNQVSLEKTTDGALAYYEWQADGALAAKHDADGWTYFTWDVDEALTGIATPVGNLSNAYDADMKRVRREEASAVAHFASEGGCSVGVGIGQGTPGRGQGATSGTLCCCLAAVCMGAPGQYPWNP